MKKIKLESVISFLPEDIDNIKLLRRSDNETCFVFGEPRGYGILVNAYGSSQLICEDSISVTFGEDKVIVKDKAVDGYRVENSSVSHYEDIVESVTTNEYSVYNKDSKRILELRESQVINNESVCPDLVYSIEVSPYFNLADGIDFETRSLLEDAKEATLMKKTY